MPMIMRDLPQTKKPETAEFRLSSLEPPCELRATGFAHSGQRPGATGQRRLRNASCQIPPSRTKTRPNRTKKMSLDSLGFLRPISAFQEVTSSPNQKMQLPSWVSFAPGGQRTSLRSRLPEAIGD